MIVLRVADVVLSSIGLVLAFPLMLLIYLLGLVDTGAPLFKQERVGRDLRVFTLIKFRTMRPDTCSVATHLVDPAAVTRMGAFLRRSKLDELPQLWNVLKGDMSLVGPRPCLYSQKELIAERGSRGVFMARPGITGLAQIQGIDMSTPRLLAEVDAAMLSKMNLCSYFGYILKTLMGSGFGDGIKS